MTSKRFHQLLAHAWDHSAFYREIYAAHGIRRQDLPHVALADLPIVGKADLAARFDEAVTDPRLRRRELEAWVEQDTNPLNLYLDEYIVVHSSSRHNYVPYTRETWHRVMTAAAGFLLPPKQHARRPLRSAFFFRPEGHHAGPTAASMASGSAHEVLRLSWFDPVEEIRARLNSFQPDRIYAIASALSWLAEWTLQARLRIAPRSVVATGERLAPAMRAQVKEAWNADIYDLYAACESLCMAVRRPGAAEFQVLTELNLLEVVDPANRSVRPGARGRVLLTSFVHEILPLIRFDLHDYAVPTTTGRAAEGLLQVEGKTDDALPVRLRDGSLGMLEIYELTQLELPGVEKIQFVAHSPTAVEIRYQSSRDVDAQIDKAFARLLAEKSARLETVTVSRVEQIFDSRPAFKLQCVVKPDQVMITPTFLAEHDARVCAEAVVSGADPGPAISMTDPAASIDQRFGEIVARYPEHHAALDGDRQLTYRELDRRVAQVAAALVRGGFDASRPVAVLCGHEVELLPLLLGVIRAGGFYLPLDPNLPAGRLQAILAEMRPEFLLSDAGQRMRAEALAGSSVTVLCIEKTEASVPDQARSASRGGLACLLYTSGSTGEPKGVVLSHATILERAERYAADYQLGPADRLLMLQSYSVSAGVREIFGALLAGATLALFDVRVRGIERLAQWLNQLCITVVYAVPTLFRVFLDTLTDEVFPAVRVVRLGGEPPRSDEVEGFRKHFSPHARLVNAYAATETDTICQCALDHGTRIVAGRISAGLPVRGVDVTLWDEQGNQTTDALGEIRVDGKMLAAGYWNSHSGRVQPLDRPFATGDLGYRLSDGRLFLAGRRDFIVKVHGCRIHLNEIERAVSAAPGIDEAAAVLRPAPRGNTIAVYYVAADGNPISAGALRSATASVVPDPVVPTEFVRLAALPRLPGGKINRSALTRSAPTTGAAAKDLDYATRTEATLARLWSEALNVPAVASGANFFDMGGDSIAALWLLDRITKRFGVALTIGEFFANAELERLARTVDARLAGR